MTAKELKRQPISTGSEWTFELIQAYDREIESYCGSPRARYVP